MPSRYYQVFTVVTIAAIFAGLSKAQAATVVVDGVRITRLSDAVAEAQGADDGPHIINITTDKLPTADGPVMINEPMTINGDADGNGVKCDILADVKAMQALPVGKAEKEKGYLEVHCAGAVTINDLQIHPNADASDVESEFVDAIRLLAPREKSDHGVYVLNRVWVSGSDGNKNDAFVPLTSTQDLYNMPGIKKWSGQDKRLARAVIQVDKEKEKRKALRQLGSYDSTLTDCQAGLGRGPALNIAPNTGKHVVNGGVFGHCGGEGVRLAGSTISLKGTPEKRIAVLRAGNEAGAENGGAVAAFFDAHIDVMEYVDIAAADSTKAFTLTGTSKVDQREEIRTVADVAEIFKGSSATGVSAASATVLTWLSPTEAWAQAQAKRQIMLLFFYSPSVTHSTQLKTTLESEEAALKFLSSYACAHVDVTTAGGDEIAKKYQIFKVPSLLTIPHDVKSFKRISPAQNEPWQKIEAQLSAR